MGELERLMGERRENARTTEECSSGKADTHRVETSQKKRDIERHLRSRIESMETVFADRVGEKAILEERYAALLAQSNQWEETVKELKQELEHEISEHKRCGDDLMEEVEHLSITLESNNLQNSKLEERIQSLFEEQDRLLGEDRRHLELLAKCKEDLMIQRAAIQNRIEGEKQLQGRVSVLPISAVEEEEADELESLITMASTRAAPDTPQDAPLSATPALVREIAARTLCSESPSGADSEAGMAKGEHNRTILRLFKKLLQERYQCVPVDEPSKALKGDANALAAVDEGKFTRALEAPRSGAGDVQQLQVLLERSLNIDPRLAIPYRVHGTRDRR